MEVLISGDVPKDVLRRLEILFATPKGSVVFDRKFGLSMDMVDLPLPLAKIRLLEEAHALIRIYEPGCQLQDVFITEEALQTGNLCFQVVVSNG